MPRRKKEPDEPRKIRSDAGNIILTERDIEALRWIIQQFAARFDQVQALLTELGEVYPQKGEPFLSYPTVMGRIQKWVAAGYVEYERILAEGPGWVFVTRKGIKVVGLQDDYPARKPDWCRLKHIFAVNQVRLFTHQDHWKDERAIKMNREPGSSKAIPDAEMWFPGDDEDDPIAVEVQLSHLTPERFQAKLEKLVHIFDGYRRVHFYVPNQKIANAAMRAREKLTYSDQGKIEIFVVPLTL